MSFVQRDDSGWRDDLPEVRLELRALHPSR